MAVQSKVRLNSMFKSFARYASLAVVLFGCMVLLGWIFNINVLKTFTLGAFTVKANSAVGFILAGISLWLALSDSADRHIHRLKQACAVLVALIGLLTLTQYIFGWNLGIDQLLFKEPVGAFATSSPGRMGPNTALNFLLIGMGLLFLNKKTHHGYHPSNPLIITALVISLLGMLGHIYGVTELYGLFNYTTMPIQTVVAFIVLCLGILFAFPDDGLMVVITNYGVGGLLARRLLPYALIVPSALGLLGLLGERAGLYDTAFGVSLLAVTITAVLVIGILVTARSINQADIMRKEAEEALLKAGALQSAIFNSANFSSIATDANGVIQIFNVGAERMLGYAAADVMNKITPADISDPQEVIARAKALSLELDTTIKPGFEALVFKASRGIEDIYELTYIRKDGSRFPAVVSVTALRDDQGTIIGYLLIGTDNTARKEIEADQKLLSQRLRDQQFYTRSLFESNIDALMTTDPSGIITDVNKQMELLTGCTRDELIGSPFKTYFTDPELAEKSIGLVLSEKKVTNYELTARARDGKETEVSYNATILYDRDRKVQGMFAAARDVTLRNRIYQELQEKNVELEEATSVADKANLAKSDFLSSMSHELRSPLNAILGFAQLMETDSPPPSPVQKQSITQILQAGWHLLKLINEILDLAKVESGQVPLSPEPVSLAEVMLECQGMVESQAQQRDIKLAFPRFDTPYFVSADRTRVKQVLLNLLSNAIKYNIEKGTVEVTCTDNTPGRIRVSIRDTGAGLDPEQQAQLFQAFNRLGQEAGGEEGTGIGLVVAKRLVELMGGVIGVESTVGVGSVFWFELNSEIEPILSKDINSEAALAKPHVHRGTQHHTLLYVEDNPANLNLVEQIIARYPDMHLLTAVTGNSGIESARASQPDVILMDINLPDINGFEALKILRADAATAHIPVIAISANAMPRDIKKGMGAGFSRYITKPIKVDEFIDALDMALESKGKKSDKRK
jgi:PAS domain S-box-containing protein